MGRDKKIDTFNHSPFKTLKGLSVSGGEKPRPVAPSKPATPPEAAEDPELFAREMAWQNVRPLDGREVAPSVPESAPAMSAQRAETEASEFFAAIGRLDKTFRDALPADEAPPHARPRRMKQLERGELKPAGELDLHGLTRDEAVARTRAFLGHAVRQGWAAVVIVTGKGLRSTDGPVLRQAVERLLREAGELVLEWGEAPRRLGGAGALVVFPRTEKRETRNENREE